MYDFMNYMEKLFTNVFCCHALLWHTLRIILGILLLWLIIPIYFKDTGLLPKRVSAKIPLAVLRICIVIGTLLCRDVIYKKANFIITSFAIIEILCISVVCIMFIIINVCKLPNNVKWCILFISNKLTFIAINTIILVAITYICNSDILLYWVTPQWMLFNSGFFVIRNVKEKTWLGTFYTSWQLPRIENIYYGDIYPKLFMWNIKLTKTREVFIRIDTKLFFPFIVFGWILGTSLTILNESYSGRRLLFFDSASMERFLFGNYIESLEMYELGTCSFETKDIIQFQKNIRWLYTIL